MRLFGKSISGGVEGSGPVCFNFRFRRRFDPGHCDYQGESVIFRGANLPIVSMTPKQNRNAELAEQTFRRLLAWLDQGVNTNGQSYLAIRARLLGYFDRKNCLHADELADETLNRVARRLDEQGGSIETEMPAKYCYIVARFVFMEYLRANEKEIAALADLGRQAKAVSPEEHDRKERMLECLDRCSAKLEASQRELIFGYYSGEQRVKIQNRRSLAQTLKITVNALSIRACRLRDRLENCVKECASH
jgi:DNA-directed RNA polymerase specialized sigma24 family protein